MNIRWLIIGLIIVLISIPVNAQNVPSEDYAKTIIIHYSIKGETVTFHDAKVIYGYPPNFIPGGDFTGKTLGVSDAPLRTFGIDDARITYTETGAIIADEANFSVKVPYSADLNAVGIYNKKGDILLIRTEIRQVKADFCKSHPNDPDCGFQLTPIVFIAGALVAVCIIAGGWYFLKKRKAAQK
jgi:hypothetical protein